MVNTQFVLLLLTSGVMLWCVGAGVVLLVHAKTPAQRKQSLRIIFTAVLLYLPLLFFILAGKW